MATTWYWAQIARHAGQYWITLPDFLGVNIAEPDLGEAMRYATEIAAEHAAELIEAGKDLPNPTDAEAIEAIADEYGRALIPIDVPGKSAKISITIDEALLARADRTAERIGESRSGFITVAVQQRIRALTADEVTEEKIASALRGVDLAKLVTEAIRK